MSLWNVYRRKTGRFTKEVLTSIKQLLIMDRIIMKNYNKLWIVPEENLVVLTTENKNLSHSNEKVLEILFLVDFDVDYPLEIEITLTNIHQFVVPSKKYPWILENMTKTDFQN